MGATEAIKENGLDPFDAFGLDPRYYDRWIRLAGAYFRWLRVTVDGLEHLPATGSGILVGNHAGHRWHDTTSLQFAARRLFPGERAVRPLIFNGLAKFLVAGHVITQYAGGVVAHPRNIDYLLERGELVLVYPEGVNATRKPFRERNRPCPPERWGSGFIRAALRTGAPIVPVAAYGFDSTVPTLWLSRRLGSFWKMPEGLYPVSPQALVSGTVPMNVGAIPLPVRCHISVLPPIDVCELGEGPEWGERQVRSAVEVVRDAIDARLATLRRRRQGNWRRVGRYVRA
ncbi:MAG: 1-acyl-sn-glycerol-3-phosphate acyltransferase [Solirubrobacterales bacterium]